jgi:sugar phosphate permease
MSANWFDYRSMGKVMATVSLSYLIGDACVRLYLGLWVRMGITWNLLFLVAGSTMIIVNALTSFFLASSPVDKGFPEPDGDPRNILGKEGLKSGIENDKMMQTFLPILKTPSIWILVLVYMGQTFIRYTMNDWIVTFFVVRTNVSIELAASISAVPPLFAAISVVIMGFLNDKLPKNMRNFTLFFYSLVVVGLCSIFYFQTLGSEKNNFYISLMLYTLLNFFLLGPYSLPASSMAVEYGGKKINATIGAIFDGLSMVGAASSGLVGSLFFDAKTPNSGWDKIFLVLFIVSILISIFNFLFCVIDCFRQRKIDQEINI